MACHLKVAPKISDFSDKHTRKKYLFEANAFLFLNWTNSNRRSRRGKFAEISDGLGDGLVVKL